MTSFANIVIKSLPEAELKAYHPQFEIRQLIANILSIPSNNSWEIVDSVPTENLYMIHYTEHADITIYGKYRGTIVDTKVGRIIRKGIGYTPTATVDELILNHNNYLEFIDENEKVHILDKFMITRGFEATNISTFKHNNKVYHATNKRIDSSKSRWGGSRTFTELYYEVGGLADNELFDEQTIYSPFVYETLLVHPSLLQVTKLPVGSGFIVSLGVKIMWDQKNTPYPDTTNPQKDFIIKTIVGTDKLPLNPTVPVVYTPVNIDLETANKHLKYGFYDQQDYKDVDIRLTPGEFVIIYSVDDSGEIIKTYKVQSTSYSWRWNTRNNDQNIRHRLYQLSSSVNEIIGTDPESFISDFVDIFPVMTPHSIKDLENMIQDSPIIVYPQSHNYLDGDYSKLLLNDADKKNGVEKRFYNIFLCLFAAIPLYMQKDYLGNYDEFIKSRYNLIAWLKNFAIKGNIPDTDDYRRVRDIITVAKKQANYMKSQPRRADVPNMTFIQSVNRTIYNFIHKERGESLYKLVKLMNNEKIVGEKLVNEKLLGEKLLNGKLINEKVIADKMMNKDVVDDDLAISQISGLESVYDNLEINNNGNNNKK